MMNAKFTLQFILCSLLLCNSVALPYISSAHAKSDHDTAHAKSESPKGKSKNDKDIVISKNSQATIYLLSGWGKADEPFVWFTLSAHYTGEQLAPNGKPFNLFSISGAQNCEEKNFFYYRVSYMFFDQKTKNLDEVFLKKTKTNLMSIESDSIESEVQKIICH